MRQFGAALPGGVEHVGLGARTLHETGCWVVITDCSNAGNNVKSTAVLVEVANCVLAITPLMPMLYYSTRPADAVFRMHSGKTRMTACSSGVQQGDSRGLRPGLKRFRKRVRGRRGEAFAYMDGVSLGLIGVTASAVRAFAFLWRELDDINAVVVNPDKNAGLPPNEHAPTAEEISLLESVDVGIAGEAGVTVIGVPIVGTDKHVLERAMELVRD